MTGFNLDGYVDVPSRMAAFYARFPEGSFQMDPPTFVEILGKSFVWSQGRAYRTPDDPAPGIGTAWEQIPGSTPYTRGSELMNLETSIWGRCCAAVMPIEGSIATAEEVVMAKARRGEAVEQADREMGTYRTPSGKTVSRGSQPATEAQVKKLRYEMKRLGIEEVILSEFSTEVLGFEIPSDGLGKLDKGQASALIAALVDKTEPVERSSIPDPDDPWIRKT